MLATVHPIPIPLPEREDPRATPSSARHAGGVDIAFDIAFDGGIEAGDIDSPAVSPAQAPPPAGIRLRRVPRWPAHLPRLQRDDTPRLRGEGPSRLRSDELSRLRGDDRGAVTAEYAVVILAAVAFAGLLVAILRSDEVRGMLLELVQNALGSAG